MPILLEWFIPALTLVLSLIFLVSWIRKRNSGRRCPPSLPSLPLVGSLPFMRDFARLPKFLMNTAQELGPIFTFRMGRKLCLVLNTKDVIEEALVKNSASYAGRDSGFMGDYISKRKHLGIVAKNFDAQYKKYRQLSLSILKEFGFGVKSLMESRILNEVQALTDSIRQKNGKPFIPKEMFIQAVYNIGISILLGRRDSYESGLSKTGLLIIAFAKNLVPAIELFPMLRFLPYFRGKLKAFVNGHADLMKDIEEEIQSIKRGDRPECFVSRYLEKEGPDYDHDQLAATIRDLLLGATDTTTNTLLWSMIFLINNPLIQERLQKEIDEAVPRKRLPLLEDKAKLPFTEATILEVLRVRTVLPLSVFQMTLSDTEISGYLVPTGTTVITNLYGAHMDPHFWNDPSAFKPERFLDGDNNIINRENVIPFSLGRRSCLGEVLAREELFLFLTGLLQQFTIRSPDGKSIDTKENMGFVNEPTPFQLCMVPRKE